MSLFDTSKLLGFFGAQSDASRAEFLELLQEHQAWAMHADTATLTHYLSAAAAEIDGTRKGRLPKVTGNVAIIPVEGVMAPKGYGAGTLAIGRAFDAAIGNDRVGGVVMLHDSPGGVVWGTPELGRKVYEA